MNIQLIVIAISCIVVGFVLSYIRRRIVNYLIQKSPQIANSSEKFDPKKFLKGFILTDPVLWTKSIFEILDLRKLLIYSLIALMILGFGYYKGWQNRPVKIDIGYGKEVVIVLNGEELYIDKQGSVFVRDSKTRKILKQITVKDIPNLKAKLSPYGFHLKPVIVAGISAGSIDKSGIEVGAGISFFRFWKMQMEAFITSHPAMYLGSSYSITDNSGVGIGLGKSLSDTNDTRIIIYGRINF